MSESTTTPSTVARSREVPEPWATALRERGFVHGGRPSMSRLASAACLAPQTAVNAVQGKGVTTVQTVDAIADALGIDRQTVAAWCGQSREAVRSYPIPADYELLSLDQQAAIVQLIRVMARERRATATTEEGRA